MIDPATQKLRPQIPRGTKLLKVVKVVKGVMCERGAEKTGLPAHRGEDFFGDLRSWGKSVEEIRLAGQGQVVGMRLAGQGQAKAKSPEAQSKVKK